MTFFVTLEDSLRKWRANRALDADRRGMIYFCLNRTDCAAETHSGVSYVVALCRLQPILCGEMYRLRSQLPVLIEWIDRRIIAGRNDKEAKELASLRLLAAGPEHWPPEYLKHIKDGALSVESLQ